MTNELTTEVIAGVHVIEEERQITEIAGFDQASPNTTSGQTVNSFNALEYSAVWQAVTLISEDVSKLDLSYSQRQADGTMMPLHDHPLTRLVNFPNRTQNYQKFWQRTVEHLLLWGNAFIWIVPDDDGNPSELIHLLPNYTTVTNLPSPENPNGDIFYRSVLFGGGMQIKLFPEAVIAIEGLQHLNWSYGAAGYNTTWAARDTIGLGKAQEDYAGKFFESGGRGGGYLEIPLTHKRPQDNVIAGFRKQFEDPNSAYKVIPLFDGAKYTPSQISPEQSQMTEAMQNTVRMVAQFYNIPPSMLGLPDSSSYGEKEQDSANYLDRCLSGPLAKIRGELNMKLVTKWQRGGHSFEYDTSKLVRPSYVPLVNGLSVGVENGIYTQNEARAKLNLGPMPGGDELKDVTATPDNNGRLADEETPSEEPTPADRDIDGHASLGRVLFQMTENARANAEKGRYARWLDGGLPTHRKLAKTILGSDEVVDRFIAATRECDTFDQIDQIAHKFEVNYGNAGLHRNTDCA